MSTIFKNDGAYDAIITREANAQGVPAALVKAFIGSESAFNPAAFRFEPARDGRPADGSRGLMQLLYSTARTMGYKGVAGDDVKRTGGLYDPTTNIRLGVAYLRDVLRQAGGKVPEAISIYNGGLRPSLGFGKRATKPVTVCLARDSKNNCINVRKVAVGQFGNQPYVDRVLGYYEQYRAASTDGRMGSVTVVSTPAEKTTSDVETKPTTVPLLGLSRNKAVLAVLGALLGLVAVVRGRAA